MGARINRRTFVKFLATLPMVMSPGARLLRRPTAAPAAGDTPNVLMLVFDTVSARHMSVYGYDRNTTPNLARFASRATVYHAHHAAGNFTTPGTASLLTGTYPWSHRAVHMHGVPLAEYGQRNLFSLLPPEMFVVAYTHNLLANSLLQHFGAGFDQLLKPRELSLADGEYSDLLFGNDYNISIWSERLIMRGESLEASSLFLSQLYRLLRSMNKRTLEKDYGQLFPNGLPNLDDIYFILEDAINWMVEQLGRMPRPFLAYLHVLPPHEPYSPRREFIGIFKDSYQPTQKPERFFSQGHSQADLNWQRRIYDEYLAYADAEFGRLLDYLESSGVLESTYVFVTSDHGEMFERGIRGHVTPTLYQPLLQVPLLISKPGQNQREDVSSATSCVDIMPTILSITGQPVPDWCEGEILPTFAGNPGQHQRTLYAVDAKRNAKQGVLSRASIAAITEQHKLVTYFGYENAPEAYELFDLHNDPDELSDLYITDSTLAHTLQGELQDKLNRINTITLSQR